MDQNYGICPLKSFSPENTESSVSISTECVGPECAWFDQSKECCAILAIAKQLRKSNL